MHCDPTAIYRSYSILFSLSAQGDFYPLTQGHIYLVRYVLYVHDIETHFSLLQTPSIPPKIKPALDAQSFFHICAPFREVILPIVQQDDFHVDHTPITPLLTLLVLNLTS
jgi:hypothetical protein